MRHVLALDQAPTKIGFAIGSNGMLEPLSGVFALPKARRSHGVIMGAVRDWLDVTIKTYHVSRVIFETPVLPAMRATGAWGLMNKVCGVIELVCDDHHIPCVETVPQNWRKFFIGVTRAPRDLCSPQTPKSRASKERRDWLKDRTKQACAARGWKVETDDEADACGLLAYALSLGSEGT